MFAGFVENADLPAILGGQHTLVMPSRQDVWGLVANEALAAGLHVVVSDAAGVSESIEAMRGVFLAPPEVAALAEQLRRSAAAWTGRIEHPEILVHDPAAFARVFSRALAPGEDDERSVGG
jgi:glycosyltransferase involved in cell wall biosynthesis